LTTKEREAANEQRTALLENDVRDLQQELDVVRRRLSELLAGDSRPQRKNCRKCGRLVSDFTEKCTTCGAAA